MGVVRMCSHPECLAAAGISEVEAGRLPVTGLVADLANPLSSPDVRAEEPAIQQQVVDPSHAVSGVQGQGLKAVGIELKDVDPRPDPLPDRFLYPYVPRWRGKGKGRQAFFGRGKS